MAKIIKYKFLSCEVNHGTEESPDIEQILLDKEIECNTQADYDANYPVAEKEAVGEIVVEGKFDEVIVKPSAQEDTDAMLIDHEYRLTLLELGLTE